MKALIVAAGRGIRINKSTGALPKPLHKCGTKMLIEHVINALKEAGVNEILIVVGYAATEIMSKLGDGKKYGIKIKYVMNEEWEKPNGLSVYKAKDFLKEDFVLSMSDHLYSSSMVKDLIKKDKKNGCCILCIDRKTKEIRDIGDATKVLLSGDKIVDIGKEIKKFNGIDCGVFFLSPYFFKALEKSQKKGDFSISGGVRELCKEGKMLYFDIGNRKWIDVDTKEELKFANKIIREIIK